MVANKKKKRKKVADMEMGMVADKKRKKEKVELDMEVDMVANMEVDKTLDVNMEIQFVERVGHGGFRPEAYPACASSLASLYVA